VEDENLRRRKGRHVRYTNDNSLLYMIFWFGAALAWKMVWDLGRWAAGRDIQWDAGEGES
jgi:hypothetical protein